MASSVEINGIEKFALDYWKGENDRMMGIGYTKFSQSNQYDPYRHAFMFD